MKSKCKEAAGSKKGPRRPLSALFLEWKVVRNKRLDGLASLHGPHWPAAGDFVVGVASVLWLFCGLAKGVEP